MINKKLIALLLSVVIVTFTFFGIVNAFASDIEWNYDSQSATLYISGSGDMDDYASPYETPWSTYLLLINTVIVGEGVTSVGNCALSGAEHLTTVTLPDSLKKIGTQSFSSCPALTELTFSENVVSIGDVSFSKIGADNKQQFTLNVKAGSYALYYAIKNGVNFNCDSVESGRLSVKIPNNSGGMKAYFPYECNVDATFIFYSESRYDPAGYLYDSNFNLLEDNDDYDVRYSNSMDMCDFSLSYSLEEGETYYFATDVINPNMKADYTVVIGAYGYDVSGELFVMNSPAGDISNVKLTDATINGVPTNGNYSVHISSNNQTLEIVCDGVTWVHTFTPDMGNDYDIPVMMCDYNGDRVVNAKDYAIMNNNNSPYKSFFASFINYRY